ncbi:MULTISPECIES: DUF397 domain-containing protein [Streptomyces]|uniref:DUF397 domain-containing protein n=1 Tax=Streptomyces TaxID=1883 RepID=UPI001154E477|nr:DUF397 domain-containing protein [Streptomyces sp. SLBN-134]TQL22303.1 uncharacterized protein DUF397 [Streptomyces sp. SLBN-134]
MTAPSQTIWFKSSYSGGSGTECVECAHTDGGTLIRDSKRMEGPIIHVTTEPWTSFVRSLAEGVRWPSTTLR